ncbi:3'-5' EXONUCLEASE DOMAIN-CONTAINING PROTEIN [Salix koriyanagi]|uniref:3'-5' EXONUCLEASE DOMAIN-CONTAINING PROTEIN n=1 Tax=Salix koriyanagi TaxID=2511006 RepID=A0A9Q0SRY7_9ROSI|nr:3'-5' EXONUCLEASE DOMAIN-CONTAINING PROTEIN [Salix koriyanagi]
MDLPHEKPLKIHLVNSTESPEFTHLTQSLTRSSIIGLDAEWKPIRGQNHQPTFPTVSLLQLACQLDHDSDESETFLLDMHSVPLPSIWELLRETFVSPDILKLGFKFKQDLVYLSSTFCLQGCDPGFDKVEPYLDITTIYYQMQHKQQGRKGPKETKSLATICKEVLGISVSKELQSTDAHCLLKIFNVFQDTVVKKGNSSNNMVELHSSGVNLGLKEILGKHDIDDKIIRIKSFEASHMFQATVSSENGQRISKVEVLVSREKQMDNTGDWQGPPPWDLSLGGDGCPKFLCDVMVEGLAKHLRCVGVDAAIPSSRKPESRELLDQAYSEQRVLLTRDAKLLRHQYLIKNQIYRVKNLLKNEQLLEVIETFQLQINEDQLMSRCTKCNGRFIQKPLTTEEAVEAAKGFQKIPDCLFNKNLEFWQCMECNQLYWEGTQYHNAVQKFIDVCKLNE